MSKVYNTHIKGIMYLLVFLLRKSKIAKNTKAYTSAELLRDVVQTDQYQSTRPVQHRDWVLSNKSFLFSI